jgi:hypothetical protein
LCSVVGDLPVGPPVGPDKGCFLSSLPCMSELHPSSPPPPSWPGYGPPFSHWQSCSHPILTLFPIVPAKVSPCLTSFHISNQFLAHGLLIALMKEVASTSEMVVNFYQTTWHSIPPKTVIFNSPPCKPEISPFFYHFTDFLWNE